jgi:replicative DNA helicase Mcm
MLQPLDITTFVFGDNTLNVDVGKKVAVGGTLRSLRRHEKDKTYQRIFDATRIKDIESQKIMPTPDEIEKFKSLKLDDIIGSFAPNIQNMKKVKEALIITLLGGVEKDELRGDINTFLVGDPGTAKTKLLQFITEIVTPSSYASGKSSSAAGLLAGVDNLSDGTRIARAGPVVLCSGGVVCIDEMDKMNSQDRSALHEAMESHKFSLVKIGINKSWPCDTIIIGAANPHGGNKWNNALSIKENVRLPDSLLSRFGLIFLVRDIPERENDLSIARHILAVRQGKVTSILDKIEMMKFINYAKTFKPTLSDEAGEFILNWWSDLRMESQKDESPTVDNRFLEDLNRIAEAYAKLRFSDIVEICDAKSAIELEMESLHTLGMNTPGKKNESISDSFNKEQYFQFVFSEPITYQMAVSKLLRRHEFYKTKLDAEKAIQSAKGFCLLIENDGVLTWTD